MAELQPVEEEEAAQERMRRQTKAPGEGVLEDDGLVGVWHRVGLRRPRHTPPRHGLLRQEPLPHQREDIFLGDL
jgi:hypothetical protein